MPNITLSVPPEIKARMDKHPDVKWSNSIRALIEQKLDDFEESEKLAKKLDINERDLQPILDKVNADIKKHSEALMDANNDRR